MISSSRAARAELLADAAVAAERAEARRHEVAHAGQPGERRGFAAHRHAEPGQLGETAGHHHRPRVVADAEALGDAAGDGDDVLQRPAELAADDVVVGVDAEQPARQHGLDRPGDGEVLGGDDAGGGLAGHDLAGDVGPGERGDRVAGQLVAG